MTLFLGHVIDLYVLAMASAGEWQPVADETWASRIECMTRRLDDVGERVEPRLIDPLA